MTNILNDGKYESDIQSGTHGDRFQKDVALLTFLYMRENPGFRLGYEVKEAGKFDDIVLIDDENEVIHFIQTKHGSVKDGNVKLIDKEALFPKRQGSGDFEISKYLASYVQVRNAFKDNKYRKKFYILTNKAYDMKTDKNVNTTNTDVVEQSDGEELLPFFGSKNLTFKLIRSAVENVKDIVNKDILEIKEAIKDLFNTGRVNKTIEKYCTPLKAVLKVDKNRQCSFLESFFSENEESGNKDFYHILKEEFDMTKKVKVDENFLQKDSRLKFFPLYVSEKLVEEFISDFFLLLDHPHDFRPLIDKALHKWLRTWLRPDILGKVTLSDMNLAYITLDESFDELSKPQQDKKRSLLGKDEILKCLDELRGTFVKTDDEEMTERNDLYINRQIRLEEGTKQSAYRKLDIIDDTQFIETFSSRLDKLFYELSKPQQDKKRSLLGKDEILKCLDELRGTFVKTDDEEVTERNELYINRQIRLEEGTKQSAYRKSDTIDDTQFVETFSSRFKNQQCIVLVADPGMGKTKFLQFFAFEVQKKYDYNVFLVFFNHLVTKLDKMNHITDFNGMISVLNAVLSKENCDIIRNAPEQRADAGFSILLVMDGFDEIHSKYTNRVIDMLRFIQTKRSIQIVISSRMHTQELLEKEFNVQSMFLEPFRERDQTEYLKKSWNVADYAEKDFKVYAKKFLKTLQRTILHNVRDICGNPLMMAMLAEIRSDDFKQYLDKVATNQKQQFGFSSDKFNVVQLYEQFIRKCFYLKCVEKSGGKLDDSDLDTMTLGHILEHQLLALKLLDIEIEESLFKNRSNVTIYDKFLKRCLQESEKSRLVRVAGEGVQFAHLSYGEYFVAKYIFDNILNLEESRVFYVFSEHKVIRKFSMLMLDGDNELVHQWDRLCKIDFCFTKWACEDGCSNIIKFLLENFKTFSKNDLDQMLRISVENGHAEVCDLLLKHIADPNEYNEAKRTALHLATRKGQAAVLELLIELTTNVNAFDEDGWTALHLAAERGNVEIMRLLITAGANINSQGKEGKTPLYIAVQNGHESASKFLIDNNADVNMENYKKETALHFVARYFWTDGMNVAIPLLLHGADLNSRDYQGRAAIHIAVETEKLLLVKALIRAGADPNCRTNDGQTPLHFAARRNDKLKLEVIEILIKAGAITNSTIGDSKLPLNFAVEKLHAEASELLSNHNNYVNTMDRNGHTALHIAVQCEDVTLVEFLLRHHADVNALNVDGYSALHMAAGVGNVSIIQVLIKAGAITNSRTNYGQTPLHIAAQCGNEVAAKVLIGHNIDVNAITVLHMAAERETLIPQLQVVRDFDITEYIASYVKVRNAFKDNKYRKKFYILTNKVYDIKTEENVKTRNRDIVKKELLPFFGSKVLTLKLTRRILGDVMDRVNKDFLEIKDAIKDMFLCGKVNKTIKNYSTPLKAVLKVDKYRQCSFLESFISENEESGNNNLYNTLKQEGYDMTQKVKVDTNFLRKDSILDYFPPYVSKKLVEEFIMDFLLLGHPHNFRPLIDKELHKWLRTWLQLDILGKVSLSDMNLAYIRFDKSFDELSKSQQDKKRSLLRTEEIQTYLDAPKEAFVKVDDEAVTDRFKLYINRRIRFKDKTEQPADRKSVIIYDTDFVVALNSRFKDYQCIVLVADAGVGKTRLLEFIASEVQKRFDYNVFTVPFNHLVKKLNKVNYLTDFNGMMNVLQTILPMKQCDIIRNAPEQRADTGFSILLVMDGFDKVHSWNTTKVIFLLKLIQTKQSIRIVISSRMHAQELLKKELCVESMFLEPFSEKDHIKYLKKRWNVPDYAEEDFNEYTQKFLENIKQTILHKARDICGYPLMMIMLAEITYDDFKQYLEKVATNQKQQIGFLSYKCNVVELFEHFIIKCLCLKYVEHCGHEFDDSDLNWKIMCDFENHMWMALKLLDSEIARYLFKDESSIRRPSWFRFIYERGKSCLVELVPFSQGDLKFSHLSYSEFFVARYTSSNIGMLNIDGVLHVLSKHKVFRKFFMLMLDANKENIDKSDRFCKIDLRFAEWACEDGCWNIIQFLLENFKSFSKNDLAQMLRISVENGYVEICELLLKHGADPNECNEIKCPATREELLINRYANVNALNKDGWTAFHLAAEMGNVQIMQSLITAGAIINSQGNEGQTPLHIAVANGHEEASKLLIDYNADVNRRNNYQETALHLAVLDGRINLVKLLLPLQANVNSYNHDGRAVIHTAAARGDAQTIQLLLEAGANPNSLTNDGKSPLHWAADYGFKDAAELLIRHNTDVNAMDEKGCTALHYAAGVIIYKDRKDEYRGDHVDVVKLLLQHQVYVNSLNIKGESALHCAAKGGYFEIAKLLIETKAITNSPTGDDELPLPFAAKNSSEEASEPSLRHIIDVNARDNMGRTALHWAALDNHYALVELLLRHNADVNVLDEDGLTVLHMAADWGDVQIIQALLSAGMSTNCRTKDGRTPLHIAAENGRDLVLKYLIDISADVNATDHNGYTALHSAADIGLVTSVKLLLHHQVNVNAVSKNGCTALHLAARWGNFKVIQALAKVGLISIPADEEAAEIPIRHKNDVNPVDDSGCTTFDLANRFLRLPNEVGLNCNAYCWAAEKGNVPIIESLIEAGAITNPRTNTGRTPLHEAAENGHYEAAELLIRHNNDVDTKDDNGCTPLHLAVRYYAWNSKKRSAQISVVESLLRHRADVNASDSNGLTALHLAAQRRNLEVIRALIMAGATTNPRTNIGRTPLHEAAENGHNKAAELLIRHNHEINSIDNEEWTALHLAARSGHVEVVKLLLEHQAEVNALNKNGCTPLQMAAEGEHDQVVELLLSSGATANQTSNPLIVKKQKEEE